MKTRTILAFRLVGALFSAAIALQCMGCGQKGPLVPNPGKSIKPPTEAASRSAAPSGPTTLWIDIRLGQHHT